MLTPKIYHHATSASAKFHCLRVYYQVQEWSWTFRPRGMGLGNTNRLLMPVKTDMPPAPKDLLRIFRCNCKTGCESRRCTCKKHGLQCTPACGECKGLSCSNSPKPFSESDLDNLDDIDIIDFYHIFKEIYSTSAVRKFMVCFTIISMG